MLALSTLKRGTDGATDRGVEVLSAYGQLTFGGGVPAGLVLLVATLERPAAAALGVLAVLVAHAVATGAGYAREAVTTGYYGFNALLVGLALAQSEPVGPRLALLVCAGAALAALLTAVLGDLLRPLGLPALALPFVLVTTLFWHTTLASDATPFWLASHAPVSTPTPFVSSVLRALGAIVFRPSELAGALVLLGAALHSRITAAALLAGAMVGAVVGGELGRGNPVVVQPAAYNGALTFAALGVGFYVPSRAGLWIAAAGAGLAAWLSAALLLPYAPLSIPVLAWPFVLVTLSLMRALALRPPGRAPFRSFLPGAAPEANLAYGRTFAKRLKLPGPPSFVLPLRGAWRVTQGVDGPLTHRGPWRHALDFEIVDDEGFPFRGDGTRLTDYYCFGEPVLAPGTGTVVAVHDGADDNPPGYQDLARPWGNAVVLEHGPGLCSVVAHLRRGSITVAVGQSVVAGQPLAECGASGRSPRPHLHFQAQARPELGAPTLDCRLVNYVVRGPTARFERFGVPAEGETVQRPELQPLAFPPAELELVDETRRRLTLRHEITMYGEHTLIDAAHGERLYFVPQVAGVLFTALRGSADGPLGALLQLMPNLPTVNVARLRFEEELAPEPLLPQPLRLAYQLLAVFGEPASANVRGELVRTGDTIVVESECQVSFLKRTVRRRRGRIELDRHGICKIELFSTGLGARPLLRAARTLAPARLAPDHAGAGQ